jgi:hypothetical protein
VARAIRLRLSVQDDVIELRSAMRVDKLIAPSDRPETGDRSGFWVEVRGDDDQLLYRRSLRNVLADTIEVFAEEGPETIARRPRQRRQEEFVVVVPDLGERTYAAFFGSPYAEGRVRGSARELARFRLG